MIYALTLPILLNMEFILNIWLKEVPEYTVVFCSITYCTTWWNPYGPLWITTWLPENTPLPDHCFAYPLTTLPATWLLLNGMSHGPFWLSGCLSTEFVIFTD